MKAICCFAFISFLLFTLSSEKNWDSNELVQRILDDNISRNPNYFIYDPHHYLSTFFSNEVASFCSKHKIHLYVIFLSAINYSNDIKDIETFTSIIAVSLSKHLNIKEENTIYAIFSINQRKMRIRTGREVRRYLYDSQCLEIIDELKPLLRKQLYNEVASTLINLLSNYYNNPKYSLNRKQISQIIKDYSVYVILFLLFFIIWPITLCCSARHNRKRKEKIRTILDKVKANKEIEVDECIICLEKLNANQIDDNTTQTLECGHKYHKECIVNWLSKNAFCPLCKDKFDKKNELSKICNGSDDANYDSRNTSTHNFIEDSILTNMIFNFQNSRKKQTNNHSHYNNDYRFSGDGSGGATGSW